ncbi:iron-containing alcohol dehydrogenase [Thalassotalea sp. Y01]|uniref:iron-containing alcohol dehydrogenase n=1 Tax=Thalassotalea sp. Y01 TaxID=2729613 RepID=UPI00145E383E|nr:iron-containing alcohol dehydrogenase [Thalassotalea sp. Y01]NMP17633.1 iron-containing alcohol dehydrogenase [Thalassotalea sp. Y01]
MTLPTSIYKLIAFTLKVAGKLLNIPKPLLLCGADSAQKLLNLIITQGSKRVLIVTDSGLAELGMIDSIEQQLKDSGIDVVIFADIMPDPDEKVIVKGIKALQHNDCELVLAIGGGSVIDASKMIAALAKQKRVDSFTIRACRGMLKIWRKGLPLYVMPTTAGTGSEATMIAVVSNHKGGQKYPIISPAICCDVAALDAKLMTGLPKAITAATGMDALTHAIEAYTSKNASAETDRYALAAVRLIFANLTTCAETPDDINARENMALASYYAGLAFNKAGVGYVHAVAHQLGAYYHIPHGLANAMVLTRVLRLNQQTCQQRFAHLANVIGIEEYDQRKGAEQFIGQVDALCQQLDIPAQVAELQRHDCADIAKAALKEAHFLYALPRYLDEQEACDLVKSLLANSEQCKPKPDVNEIVTN